MALVVRSSIKKLTRTGKMRTSKDLWEALDEKVEKMVNRAVDRAKSNGRKTLRACDL